MVAALNFKYFRSMGIHRIRIQSKITIRIRILCRIRIQAISYNYLKLFFITVLHNYNIFSSKEVNEKTECCKSHQQVKNNGVKVTKK